MSNELEVSGIELRNLLTTYLFDHGSATVGELVEALTYHGFRLVAGQRSRYRMHCAGRRCTGGFTGCRSRYGPGSMPRATAYRMNQRVLALHARVAELSLPGGQEGYFPDLPATG